MEGMKDFNEGQNTESKKIDPTEELMMLTEAPTSKNFQEQKTMFIKFFNSEEFDADSLKWKWVLWSFEKIFKDNIERLEKANIVDKDINSVIEFLKDNGNFGKMWINDIMAIKNDGKWFLTDANWDIMDVDMWDTHFEDIDFARKNEQWQPVVAVKLNWEWTTINLETKEKTHGRLMKKKAK